MADPFTQLRASLWALSAIRVAAESDLLAAMGRGPADTAALAAASAVPEAIVRRVCDVLDTYGLAKREGDRHALTDDGKALAARDEGLVAELTAAFGQTQGFVEEARRGDLGRGWRHVDAEVIRAQGTLSDRMMRTALGPLSKAVPQLELLAKPGARFLDVGVGAAGGAIALCMHHPHLHVVGLEPLPAARREASSAVTQAGLDARIEIRPDRVEALDETAVYAGAFLASQFFDDATLAAGLAAVHRALVPGGVALFSAWHEPDDRRIAVTSALRSELWGGGTRPAATVVEMARAAGFEKVIAAPPMGDIAPLVAIR